MERRSSGHRAQNGHDTWEKKAGMLSCQRPLPGRDSRPLPGAALGAAQARTGLRFTCFGNRLYGGSSSSALGSGQPFMGQGCHRALNQSHLTFLTARTINERERERKGGEGGRERGIHERNLSREEETQERLDSPAEVLSLPTRRLEARDFMDAPWGACWMPGSAGCGNPSAMPSAFHPPLPTPRPEGTWRCAHRTPRAGVRDPSRNLCLDPGGRRGGWLAASAPGLNLSSRPAGCCHRSAWSPTVS